MDFSDTGCEDGRWIELAQDFVQWRDLALANVETFVSTTRELVN
jgi:hypothetical protein